MDRRLRTAVFAQVEAWRLKQVLSHFPRSGLLIPMGLRCLGRHSRTYPTVTRAHAGTEVHSSVFGLQVCLINSTDLLGACELWL